MPQVVRSRMGLRPKRSLRPPMTGEATNWRKEKREPRRPPNSTGMKESGAPTREPKCFTFDSCEKLLEGSCNLFTKFGSSLTRVK